MQLVDPTRGVCVEILEVKGMLGRMQGLLGQGGLPPGVALRLRTKQVHTVGMRFAIDTIYLSSQGSVVRVATMPPGRIGPIVLRARWILEMAAGEAERLGIAEGTSLVPAAG